MITDDDLLNTLRDIKSMAMQHYAALAEPDQPLLDRNRVLALGVIASLCVRVMNDNEMVVGDPLEDDQLIAKTMARLVASMLGNDLDQISKDRIAQISHVCSGILALTRITATRGRFLDRT